jgi:lysophospholipase L1-like esterase
MFDTTRLKPQKTCMKNVCKIFGLLIGLSLLTAGCDSGGGGGGGGDIGDNTAGVVLAVGDSITNGSCNPAGAPYPSRISPSRGFTVINAGKCGETAVKGAGRIGGLLQEHKPEAILVLYGANDAILGVAQEDTLAAMRSIIQQAKANKTRVIVGTVMPMYDSHSDFQPRVEALNIELRKLIGQEKAQRVDLAREFGTDRSIIQEDGLHPTDMGTQIIAFAFAERL